MTFDLTHLIRMHIEGKMVTITDIRTNSYNMLTNYLYSIFKTTGKGYTVCDIYCS